MIKKIGFAITGSFCTHKKILDEIESLVKKGYIIIPILSPSVTDMDTRFGKASDFLKKLDDITKTKPITNIVQAEPVGPKNLIDILVIAPCTGNTLAKLANAVTDNAVTMVAKAHMRNNKKVVIGISTNDALGINMHNIAKLINAKNVFFVPFGQDDAIKKPKSLVCDYTLLEPTLLAAANDEQLQPLLLRN